MTRTRIAKGGTRKKIRDTMEVMVRSRVAKGVMMSSDAKGDDEEGW